MKESFNSIIPLQLLFSRYNIGTHYLTKSTENFALITQKPKEEIKEGTTLGTRYQTQ